MSPTRVQATCLAPVALCAATALSLASLVEAASITSLSDSSVPISGRFRILGSGFGASQGASQVLIDGVPAAVTTWTDGAITAYITLSIPAGPAMLAVAGPGGTSDPVPMTIEPLAKGEGQVAWRFTADADYISQRQAVASDGTIYVQDLMGHVYALAPGGGLKWIFNTGGLSDGPVGVGPDGTVYACGDPAGPDVTIFAINPDGTLKWSFTDPGTTQGVIAGPSVGPDGNIYAVTDIGGLGALSLSPSGELRWNNPGDPPLSEYAQQGQEIAFSASNGRMYVAFDEIGIGAGRTLFSFSLEDGDQEFAVPSGDLQVTFSEPPQPEVGPNGHVFMNTGNAIRSFHGGSGSLLWTALQFTPMTKPSVGPDGHVHVVRQLSKLTALSASGSTLWTHTDTGILFNPMVSPDGSVLVIGGREAFGQPGFFKAFTAAGQQLWKVPLPAENGANVIPGNRPTFSPSGATAYVGTSIPGQSPADKICFLYALHVAEPIVSDLDGDGAVDGADLGALLAAWGPCGGCAEDLTGDGVVDGADLGELLSNWE